MTTNTGRNALCILLSRQHHISLVVVNANLPDMCSFEFINKLEKLMSMPIVMVCDVYDQDTITKGYQSGAMRCLVKPLWFHDIKDLWQLPIVKNKEFIRECSRFLMSTNAYISHESRIRYQQKNKRNRDEFEIGQSSNVVWTPEVIHKFLSIIQFSTFSKPVASPSMIACYINTPGFSTELVAEKIEQFRYYLIQQHKFLYNMVSRNLLETSAQSINVRGDNNGAAANHDNIRYSNGESLLAKYLENPYSRQQLKRVINVALLKWENEPNAMVVTPPPPPTTDVPPISVPFALAKEIEKFIHTSKAINVALPGFLHEVASLVGSYGYSASAELEGNGEELEPGFLERLDRGDIFDAIEELRD